MTSYDSSDTAVDLCRDELPVWLTTEQTAAYYQTVPATVRYWQYTGELRGVRSGKRLLFHRDEIRRRDRKLLETAKA